MVFRIVPFVPSAIQAKALWKFWNLAPDYETDLRAGAILAIFEKPDRSRFDYPVGEPVQGILFSALIADVMLLNQRETEPSSKGECSMKPAIVTTMAGAVVTVCAVLSLGQSSPQMPAPGPEVKRLGYFVGKWRGEGEMKSSPFGPGGKYTESEDVEWMPGGFFVLIHSDEKSPMGNGKTLMILGYNSEKKAYTFNAFDSMGEAETATGTLEGDTWTWLSDSTMAGKPVRTRFTMKELSPTSYSTKFEMSSDRGAWSTIMEGKTTKVK